MDQQQVFVGREVELSRLGGTLGKAVGGKGQLVFLSGDAGTGKTSLIFQFARQALSQYPDLIIAIGQSDAQTGAGDAYLPFREMLAQLTGDTASPLAQTALPQENVSRLKQFVGYSAQAVVDLGPDLIGIFIPGAGLATRAAAFVAEKAGWLDTLSRLTEKANAKTDIASGVDQSHIFEQYTNVLIRLAQQHPLLLVLDDLQWADNASISLLFRLGRRLREQRVFLVGAFRPAEVALGRDGERHPLDKVLNEFQRYYGEVIIDLNQSTREEGRAFVQAFLDTEANGLSEAFADALYHHTGGHPLFTVELLRAMQERGAILQDENGRWVEAPTLDWDDLPTRVEGVIAERIGRLEEELKQTLTIASVEGEVFTAEVVAQIRNRETRQLVRQMSQALEKQHHLVASQGSQRLSEGQKRLSFYRFQHNLFQKYLYGTLDEAERAYLHEDIGLCLESLYGVQADEIAVQLAQHFSLAELPDKARHYLFVAGNQAAEKYANQEALRFYARALELTSPDDLRQRIAILSRRQKVLRSIGTPEQRGEELAQMEAHLAELENQGEDMLEQRVDLWLHQTKLGLDTPDLKRVQEICQQAIEHLGSARFPEERMKLELDWGFALYHMGQFDMAREHIARAGELAEQTGSVRGKGRVLAITGALDNCMGDYENARLHFNQARQAYQECADLFGVATALNGLAITEAIQANLDKARLYFEAALEMNRKIGFRFNEATAVHNLGAIEYHSQHFQRALVRYDQAKLIYEEMNDLQGQNALRIAQGEVYLKMGDLNTAEAFIQDGLNFCQEMNLRRAIIGAHVFLGFLGIYREEYEDAIAHAQTALESSISAQEKVSESSALMVLGHAHHKMGDLDQALAFYQQAYDICCQLGDTPHTMESLACLAQVSLQKGEVGQVRAWSEDILRYLEEDSLINYEEPLLVYWKMYQILSAQNDPRANDVLAKGMVHLERIQNEIEDEEVRTWFVENIPYHRNLKHAAMMT